jgi:hypothetical protein
MSTNVDATASASAGVGYFGWLILFGVLGLGPCADDCQGCGPTLADVVKQAPCECSCVEGGESDEG